MTEKEALLERLDDLDRIYDKKCCEESRLKQYTDNVRKKRNQFFFPRGDADGTGYEKYHLTLVSDEVYAVKGKAVEEELQRLPEVYGEYEVPAKPVLKVKKPEDTKKTPEEYGVKNLQVPVKLDRQLFYLPSVGEAIIGALIVIIVLVLLKFDFKTWFGFLGFFVLGFVIYVNLFGDGVKKYRKSKNTYPQRCEDYEKDQETIQNYEKYSKEFDEYLVNSYPELHEEYEEARIQFNAEMEKYAKQYNAWIDEWLPILKSRQDQADVAYDKLIADQQSLVQTCRTEFSNAKTGFLGDRYIDYIDEIEGILNDGRADTLKEALAVLEDVWHKETLEEAAHRQAEAAELQAEAMAAQAIAAQERAEAEWARAEAESARAEQEAKWHAESERMAREATRKAQDEDARARSDGRYQCNSCANRSRCNVVSSNRGSCPSWRPRG